MTRIARFALFFALTLLAVGCTSSAKEDDATSQDSAIEDSDAQAKENEEDDAPVKAEFDAELLQRFEGELTAESDRRPEDKTPVEHHEFELKKGDHIYVEMEAVDTFRTYLMIATPNRTGGHQNSECYPGQGLSSCVRFIADQDGPYLFMANAASPKAQGKYTLSIYKETEEQAKANTEAHAEASKKSEERLKKHLEKRQAERKEEAKKRVEEFKKSREAQKKANDAKNTDDDAPKNED